jgi:hypothetical protein
VDAIVPGYESLELDVVGPEEEATLGEVLGGVILWDKKHIVFPGSAPRRPPSPQSPRNSPPPDDDRDDYHSPSPHRSPPQCQPPPPPLPTRKSQSYGKSAAMLMRYGVDSFSPSNWVPQEEGMINIAARFSLS